MIRLLKRFADWLDRRFPPKLTITRECFDNLLEREYGMAKEAKSLKQAIEDHQARIAAAEEAIRAVKDLLAKGGVSQIKPEAEKLREQFVKGEFNRGPSRAEVESAA